MDTVKVKVVVYEDNRPVAEQSITYYREQDYEVKVDTPDGTDLRLARKAGAANG